MSIAWLMLLVAVFLAAGAVRLGAMGIALAAGAADVLTRQAPRATRAGAIFLAAFAIAAAWSVAILRVLVLTIETSALLRTGFSGVGAVVAAAPALLFATEIARAREARKEVIAAIGVAAAANGAFVLAILVWLVGG